MPEERELPGGDIIPDRRERDFATDVLPLLIAGAVILCLLCGVPALGFLGYAVVRDTRAAHQAQNATFAAEFHATQAVAITATAEAESILTQPPSDWRLLYEQDFAESDGHWLEGEEDQAWGVINREISAGEYVWTLDYLDDSSFWSWPGSLRDLSDFYVSVEADQTTEDWDLTSYGFNFRMVNGSHMYTFEVSETGEFGFWKRVNDEWEDIIAWQDTDLVRRGGVNKLAVRAEGNHFVLLINDRVAAQAYDSTFTQGRVGLTASGFQNGVTTTIAFDNFVVYAP